MWPVVSDALLPFGKVERPPKAAFQLAALLNFRRRKLRASALAYAQQLVIHAVRLPRSCDREVTGAVDQGNGGTSCSKMSFFGVFTAIRRKQR